MAIHLTDKLVYWHMPKTGGHSVYKYMQHAGLGFSKISGYAKHGKSSDIPASLLKSRSLFGTVRNPWEWYVSFYNMAMRDETHKELLRKYGNGSLEFHHVLRGLTSPLGSDIILSENFTVIFDIENPQEELDDFLCSGLGLFSWVFRYCYGRPVLPEFFVDTKQLQQGVAELLLTVPDELNGINPQNKSEHFSKNYIGPAETLYDKEMIDWVYASDISLITTFGFEPWKEMKSPTVNASDLQFSPSFV